MKQKFLYSMAALLLASLTSQAHADSFQFSFTGGTTSGNIQLTYGPTADSKSGGLEVTGISGTFSDSFLGISNATILGLTPINHATPESTNHLAPNDFSKFVVAAGTMDGSESYDNLFYPAGSPPTATDYTFHGGFLDIYGLMFNIGGGDLVNIWSNGVTPGQTLPDYNLSVVDSAAVLDFADIAVSPEPSSLCLLGTGMLAILLWRRPSLLGIQS